MPASARGFVLGSGFLLGRNCLGFIQLVHFLSGKTGFGHGSGGLGEAVIEVFVVADTDGVGNLVPIVVGVKAVAVQGFLSVLQPVLTAGEGETVQVMDQPAFAHHVDMLEVHQHGDVHFGIQFVLAVQDLLTDLRPFPGEPIGDVGEFRFALQGLQLADGGQLVDLAAGVAGQVDAAALGLALCAAVGTFVEDPLQAVGPGGVMDFDALGFLPLEVVKAEGFVQTVAQLLDAEAADLFLSEEAPGLGTDGDALADL